jgi:hypothetical protein
MKAIVMTRARNPRGSSAALQRARAVALADDRNPVLQSLALLTRSLQLTS